MRQFTTWLRSLFSRKSKDTAWNELPYPQGKYKEPDINERNQV